MSRGIAVIHTNRMLEINKTTDKYSQQLYGGTGVVITVGDGDFTFSTALASQYTMKFPNGKSRLIATAYDSMQDVLSKYSTGAPSVQSLRNMNIPTLYRIDATRLYESIEIANYRASKKSDYINIPSYVGNCSRIIFNFPHIGGFDPVPHRELLSKFFLSCLPLLIIPNDHNNNEYGEIHIALRNTPFYESWNVEELGKKYGYKLLSKDVFVKSRYPNYEEQRTNPGLMRSAPPNTEGATIYRFIIDDNYINALKKSGSLNVPHLDLLSLASLPTRVTTLGKPVDTPETVNNINAEDDTNCETGQTMTLSKTIIELSSSKPSLLSVPSSSLPDASNKTSESTSSTIKNDGKATTTQLKNDIIGGKQDTIQMNQIISLEYDISKTYENKNLQKLPIYSSLPSDHYIYRPYIKTITMKSPQYLDTIDSTTRNYREGITKHRDMLGQYGIAHKQYSDQQIAHGIIVMTLVRQTEYEEIPDDIKAKILLKKEKKENNTIKNQPTHSSIVVKAPVKLLSSKKNTANTTASITKTAKMAPKDTNTSNNNNDDDGDSSDFDYTSLSASSSMKANSSTLASKNKDKNKDNMHIPLHLRKYKGIIVGVMAQDDKYNTMTSKKNTTSKKQLEKDQPKDKVDDDTDNNNTKDNHKPIINNKSNKDNNKTIKKDYSQLLDDDIITDPNEFIQLITGNNITNNNTNISTNKKKGNNNIMVSNLEDLISTSGNATSILTDNTRPVYIPHHKEQQRINERQMSEESAYYHKQKEIRWAKKRIEDAEKKGKKPAFKDLAIIREADEEKAKEEQRKNDAIASGKRYISRDQELQNLAKRRYVQRDRYARGDGMYDGTI